MDQMRDNIHSTIQANSPMEGEAILTNWVLVAEWMDVDGKRWISRAFDQGNTSWKAKGMLHEGMYGFEEDD